jgi:D-glycero-alpha-D-manno-heptose-7-phosphate kinase
MSSNLATLRAMREMVDEGAALLEGDAPLEQFGRLLHEAWVAKRSLEQGVSQVVIDEMYEAGKSAGAYGGKLLGAGGGGFLLFFASPETHPRLRDIFSNMQLLDVRVDAPGSSIIFSSGNTPA